MCGTPQHEPRSSATQDNLVLSLHSYIISSHSYWQAQFYTFEAESSLQRTDLGLSPQPYNRLVRLHASTSCSLSAPSSTSHDDTTKITPKILLAQFVGPMYRYLVFHICQATARRSTNNARSLQSIVILEDLRLVAINLKPPCHEWWEPLISQDLSC